MEADMEKYKGRIVDIEKYQNRAVYLKQGVKGPEQYKYDKYPGGNGTYVTGGEYYGTILNVKVFVYDFNKCVTFDVYEDILAISGKKKISAQLFSIIESHEGNKVNVYSDDGNNFLFDSRVLLS